MNTQLLNESDVLLFRHGKFPSFGWWISKYTRSQYSHAGIVSFIDNEWHVVEFREFIGSRIIPLKVYLSQGSKIDVFRTCQNISFCDENGAITEYNFTEEIAADITSHAKQLIGKSYGWNLIWYIVKTYVPFIRLFQRQKPDSNGDDFVCSTLVSYLWRKHFVDPVAYLPDKYTTTGDLARSALFTYQFTLEA